MKQISLIFSMGFLWGCSQGDYPKLRDVPADVKPTLTFQDAQLELKELQATRDSLKGK